MVHEALMRELPKDHERVSEDGIFYIRDNSGSWSVVVLAPVLVTCGGENGKGRATHLARCFNNVWNEEVGK
ncbi:MAG: hypothetical protein KJI72_00340 [Patescibacteria group bacterium]|nr:hypothetical protein [Patescibacteria group bacterium]